MPVVQVGHPFAVRDAGEESGGKSVGAVNDKYGCKKDILDQKCIFLFFFIF